MAAGNGGTGGAAGGGGRGAAPAAVEDGAVPVAKAAAAAALASASAPITPGTPRTTPFSFSRQCSVPASRSESAYSSYASVADYFRFGFILPGPKSDTRVRRLGLRLEAQKKP